MKDEIKVVALDKLKPYWRNPRTGDADAVRESIKAYGYNQYIVVDKDFVIIVGHTRYKALQSLALTDPQYKEVPVIVSALDEKQAKEYRIIDNQTGDRSEWILDKLSQELREIDGAVAVKYFTNEELDRLVRQGAGAVGYTPVDTSAVEKSKVRLDGAMIQADQERKHIAKLVICPNCSTEFEVS